MFDESYIRSVYEDSLLKTPPILDENDKQKEYIIKYIPADRSVALLDAGCGNGRYARHLAKIGYTNITGIDLFDQIDTDGLFYYKKARLDSLPFEDDTFDFIFSNSVVHYLDNTFEGLQEFYRVLKPHGRVMITAHTRYSLFTLWRIIKRYLGLKSAKHLIGLHFYSALQYQIMLKKCGFSILRLDGYNYSTVFHRIIRKASRVFGTRHQPKMFKYTESHKTVALLRSLFSYHAILIAQKRLP